MKYLLDNLEIGPFCPATIEETGGIWEWDCDNPGLYRIDGDFLQMLADQGYTFYDENDDVCITGVRTEQPAFDHTCLSVSVDESVEITTILPMTPKRGDSPTDLGVVAQVGIGIDGLPIFADAPSVLDRVHLPALDTCGRHVDPDFGITGMERLRTSMV